MYIEHPSPGLIHDKHQQIVQVVLRFLLQRLLTRLHKFTTQETHVHVIEKMLLKVKYSLVQYEYYSLMHFCEGKFRGLMAQVTQLFTRSSSARSARQGLSLSQTLPIHGRPSQQDT